MMKGTSLGFGLLLIVLNNAAFSVFLIQNQAALGLQRPPPALVSFNRRAVLKAFLQTDEAQALTKERLLDFEAGVQAQLERFAAQHNVVIIADLPVIAGVRDITGYIKPREATND